MFRLSFLQLFLGPNGSIPLDKMTQALTLSEPQSKSSASVPWFLLLLWALVTITLLLIYGLCFLKLPVKTCLLLMTTDLCQDNNDAERKPTPPKRWQTLLQTDPVGRTTEATGAPEWNEARAASPWLHRVCESHWRGNSYGLDSVLGQFMLIMLGHLSNGLWTLCLVPMEMPTEG